jgi:hypothetical protein
MAIEIDADFKIDTRRVDYRDPQSAVAALVQMPSYLIDGYSLANAVMKDWRPSRRAALEEVKG